MAETFSTSQLYYFGISPYLSSENALARFPWGLAERTKDVSEIQAEIAQSPGMVVIPSHLWWRPDCNDILVACYVQASRVKLQIGPGFEMKTHLSSARSALELGYHLQVLIQAPLNPEQKSRLKSLLQNFKNQIEFLFLWQECQTDSIKMLEELKVFGIDHLSLGLTQKNWSQIYPELKNEALKQLPVYDFEQRTVSGLSEIVEQTGIAKKTKKFRSSRFQFPVKELFRLLSHFFLLLLVPGKKSWELFRQSSKSLAVKAYGSLIQRVYWDFLFQIYWNSFEILTRALGQGKALQVRFFWLFYGGISNAYQWCKDYPFWPVRKMYWFLRYQLEKRVLRK